MTTRRAKDHCGSVTHFFFGLRNRETVVGDGPVRIPAFQVSFSGGLKLKRLCGEVSALEAAK